MDFREPNRSPIGHRTVTQGTQTVLLFGELLADVFPDRRVAGGAPFNVACHLAALGASPLLVSRVGHDELGDFLTGAMRRFSLDVGLLQTDFAHPSGRVEVVVEAGVHRFEIPPEQAFDYIDSGEIESGLAGLPAPDLVYFGTLAQRSTSSRAALQVLRSASNAPCFVDLNLRPPWVSRGVVESSLDAASVVKLGEDELRTLGVWFESTGYRNDGGDSICTEADRILADALARHHRIEQVFVTCGARGAWCLADERIVEVPASAAAPDAGDTVGAGDAFAAILILSRLAGWSLTLTLERASSFAAAICTITGATPSSRDFYTPFAKDWIV